jgi:beta-aspartyl-peptidase (threonine type)
MKTLPHTARDANNTTQRRPLIAIHGGAGTISRATMSPAEEAGFHDALQAILLAGQTVLIQGGSALDAVTEAVRLLEDCELFNAGKGAVYTRAGTHELDAAIMDGATLAAGAIANVSRVRNPILAARAIMAHSEHIMLVGASAETYVSQHGVALVDPAYFQTESRYRQWLLVREQDRMVLDHDAASEAANARDVLNGQHTHDERTPPKMGTVGAVALDCNGNLAAATSTGGITNKLPGRVGDSPLIGAGCYANNATVAVSATGTGEAFMRTLAAYDISARMAYAGATLEQAANAVVMEVLPAHSGRGGLIAIDGSGNLALPFNTEGMYRGYARGAEMPVTAIYR